MRVYVAAVTEKIQNIEESTAVKQNTDKILGRNYKSETVGTLNHGPLRRCT